MLTKTFIVCSNMFIVMRSMEEQEANIKVHTYNIYIIKTAALNDGSWIELWEILCMSSIWLILSVEK